MKDSTMKQYVKLAADEAGPISTISNASIEQNIVLVTKLEKGLTDAGYDIQYEDKENGAWAKVWYSDERVKAGIASPELKAQGYSGAGREDALLHAGWGAVREEEASKSVGAKLEKHGIKVDDRLRQKLETVHITEGPAIVDGHLMAMKA